jgi:translation elongation factor EF-Ts
MTESMQRAVEWLRQRGGSGIWDKRNRLIAAGEIAPFYRATWKRLNDVGIVSIANKRVTLIGQAAIQ